MSIFIYVLAILSIFLSGLNIYHIIWFYKKEGLIPTFYLASAISASFSFVALYFAYLAISLVVWWPLAVCFLSYLGERPHVGMWLSMHITGEKEDKAMTKHWSKEISRLSDILGNPSNARITLENADDEQKLYTAALDDLYNLCMTVPMLKMIMDGAGADDNSIRRIYSLLVLNGAGQWVKGKFVPVEAIGHERLLLFLLQKDKDENAHWQEICMVLVEYFKGNRELLKSKESGV